MLSAIESCQTNNMSLPGAPFVSFRTVAPYLSLAGGRETLIKTRPWKKTPRYKRNQLKRQGTLEFRRAESKEEMYEVLPVLTELHIQRRADCGDESFLADDKGQRFVKQLIERFAESGLLQLHWLSLGEKIIALCMGFETQQSYSYYVPTFDSEWSKFAPGSVLLSYLIEDCINREIPTFDFGQGDESYKQRFATSSGQLNALHLFRRGIAALQKGSLPLTDAVQIVVRTDQDLSVADGRAGVDQ
ncbi:MAG: hypothetical protein CMJ78_22875 [Planctomycetaceae bacterium]|nr:hypothetical protein [Planctomycetaceae bacterium]